MCKGSSNSDNVSLTWNEEPFEGLHKRVSLCAIPRRDLFQRLFEGKVE
jgi:hypothetical protein